jgi:hypothetical protein
VLPDAGQGKVYGNIVPLTFGISSGTLLAGDAFTGTLGLLSENVGTTSFTLGTLLAGGRYRLLLDPSSPLFTITPRAITISAIPGQNKLSGESDPVFLYSITQGNLVNGDFLTGALSRSSGEDPGSYVYQLGTLANPNYTLSFNPGTFFTILPATARPVQTMNIDAFNATRGRNNEDESYYTKTKPGHTPSQGTISYSDKPAFTSPGIIYSSSSHQEFKGEKQDLSAP